MKYIKTYESFNVSETMDMMFFPVDPLNGYEDLWDQFKTNMKKKIKEFIENIKQEGRETVEAFKLCVKASDDKIDLNKEERNKIWKQLGDVFKTIGLTLITLIPGDIVIFMLIKLLKIEKYVFPSAFTD
jgi:hypothetical protein